MSKRVLVLPGDGIGPEIVAEAVKVLDRLVGEGLALELDEGLVGGAGYDAAGDPLPTTTLDMAKEADAVLLGASSLRPEIVAGLDIMIVRELTGGIYFGQPRGIRELEGGERQGFNTLVYAEHEIERIVRSACEIAMRRGRRLCSVDKANVLECTELWREVATRVVTDEYPDVELSHMYVDNAAMQLVKWPKQFDVIVTTNMFGDILSDAAAMLTGSIGMLPSASLNEKGQGMYEPIHGSAPDIAGQGIANPLATILSVAMMLRFSLGQPELADRVEKAVDTVLDQELRTPDILSDGMTEASCEQMGDAVVAAL